MTPAEMECCKKMAGNCDMGGGDHRCCDTTMNRAAPTAAIVHSAVPHEPALAIVSDHRVNLPELEPLKEATFLLATTSPSPPGFATVLRI
jgi:hypothetical protein